MNRSLVERSQYIYTYYIFNQEYFEKGENRADTLSYRKDGSQLLHKEITRVII